MLCWFKQYLLDQCVVLVLLLLWCVCSVYVCECETALPIVEIMNCVCSLVNRYFFE